MRSRLGRQDHILDTNPVGLCMREDLAWQQHKRYLNHHCLQPPRVTAMHTVCESSSLPVQLPVHLITFTRHLVTSLIACIHSIHKQICQIASCCLQCDVIAVTATIRHLDKEVVHVNSPPAL